MKKFELNLEPLEKAQGVDELSILLYGYEKIGKTSFANEFPDPYFLFTEPGHRSLPGEVIGTVVEDWTEFAQAAKQLVKMDDFTTVVVDTVDIAYEMAMDYVCRRDGMEHPSDGAYGKGWKAVSTEFSRVVRMLQRAKGTLFISHAKEAEITTAAGAKRNRIVPTMSPACRKIIEPAADVWMLYQYAIEGGRELVIRGSSDTSAGTRCSENFVGVDSIPAGKSAAQAYSNFMAAYDNKLDDPKPKRRVRRKKTEE